MRVSRFKLAQTLAVLSADYGYYRMNNTAFRWLHYQFPRFIDVAFEEAENIRDSELYRQAQEIVEARPIRRIV
jgi:hypothetical protein